MERKDWSKFAQYFHPSWETKMRPFIESIECKELYDKLIAAREQGKLVVPYWTQTYRAFKETNLEEMKAMICGFSPYHTLKDRKIVADGILMSASNTGHLPPSLEQFYDGMERDLFPETETGIIRSPDLAYLCHEGVFMFNTSMTCELLKAGSHADIWLPFTKYVLEEIITIQGIPIIWLGKDAAKYDRYVNPFQWRFMVEHPAYAARQHTTWDTQQCFTKVNRVIRDNNKQTIRWAEELPF